MNLLHGFETHETFFWRVTLGLALSMVAMLGGAIIYGVRGKLI